MPKQMSDVLQEIGTELDEMSNVIEKMGTRLDEMIKRITQSE
jgi:hypothetical protein